MSDLVRTPEDQFSYNEAQIRLSGFATVYFVCHHIKRQASRGQPDCNKKTRGTLAKYFDFKTLNLIF